MQERDYRTGDILAVAPLAVFTQNTALNLKRCTMDKEYLSIDKLPAFLQASTTRAVLSLSGSPLAVGIPAAANKPVGDGYPPPQALI